MAEASLHSFTFQVLDAMDRRQRVRVLGAEPVEAAAVAARAVLEDPGGAPVVMVVPDDAAAAAAAADVAFFLGSVQRVSVVTEHDVTPYADVSPDPRTVGARLAAVHALRQGKGGHVVILSVRSALRKTLAPQVFETHAFRVGVGDELSRETFLDALLSAGFYRGELVEDPGTFAVRGGVIDVYPPGERFPLRLELFGDEVDRITRFDPDSQRSLRQVDGFWIHPVRETIRSADTPVRERIFALADAVNAPTSRTREVLQNIEQGVDFFGIEAVAPALGEPLCSPLDHLPANAKVITSEPKTLLRLAQRIAEDIAERFEAAVEQNRLVAAPEDFYLSPDALIERLWSAQVVIGGVEDVSDERRVITLEQDRNTKLRAALDAGRTGQRGEPLAPLVDELKTLSEIGDWRAILVAPNKTHADRFASLLRGHGFKPRVSEDDEPGPVKLDPRSGPGVAIDVVPGRASQGFRSVADRVLLLSEQDIFGRSILRARTRKRRSTGVGNLSALSVGDYVVHITHGVGRYTGLCKLSLGGVPGDFVLVEYAGSDKLYLPVYRLGEIDRYVAGEGKAPRLDKMGGVTFAAKKKKVHQNVAALAEELLKIYAQREALDGHAYPEPDELYQAFESTFAFEETPDQQDAIDAVNGDLTKRRPMDRLVCGDVGFGKTEVALRAAFRAASTGKQVAVLAPTTVLVAQHQRTFEERLAPFGLNVGSLNRFVPTAQRNETLEGIRTGSVDVVVGTHRLLSRDVKFRNLGLVVIDEEQRFGVAQKERFKKLKSQVDVLTLTATPIPRTLHMSLLGIREISLITTPPQDRLAVRTFLARASDSLIEENVRRELRRGGQVFYVVPKIAGIDEHARRIADLVPEARVLVAHGRMPGELLQKTMVDFVEHRADVLVSTTIVESGLDIPRANTMFIARADMFGLAQLYQLRGRIGRSRQRAYCYLMVNSLERLAKDGRKRLEAIVRHSDLGSGFNIASQDLEIRGAGEMLGAKQSGAIAAIGFEAYARALKEAVGALRGEPILREQDPELALDLPAYLPDDYVEDMGMRLDFYRRLSAAGAVEDVAELLQELEDRFGAPPTPAKFLGEVTKWRIYGAQLRASSVELRGDRLFVRLSAATPLSSETALALRKSGEHEFKLISPDRLATTLDAPSDAGRLRAATGALSRLCTLAQA